MSGNGAMSAGPIDRLSDDGTLSAGPGLREKAARAWGDPRRLSAIRRGRATRSVSIATGNNPGTGTCAIRATWRGRSSRIGTLGAYEIDAEIGRGGMGTVYLARDRTTGRLVAREGRVRGQ